MSDEEKRTQKNTGDVVRGKHFRATENPVHGENVINQHNASIDMPIKHELSEVDQVGEVSQDGEVNQAGAVSQAGETPQAGEVNKAGEVSQTDRRNRRTDSSQLFEGNQNYGSGRRIESNRRVQRSQRHGRPEPSQEPQRNGRPEPSQEPQRNGRPEPSQEPQRNGRPEPSRQPKRNGRPERGEASRQPHRASRGSLVLSIIATILLVVGIGLFSYPMIDSWRAQQEAYQTIESSMQSDTADAPSGTTAEGKRAKEGDPAYEYLAAYNEQVRNGTGEAVNDPWGIGSNDSELSSIGLANDIVGSITIDRLNETIPLYLGASRAHLAYGACVTAGTSMPLGGVGNNCVIAGHRGAWHGLTMFRDIEDIQLGDLVVINTPWDTLTYRAAEIQVVTPNDTDAVKPQPGRDLVTLLTCHPYGHNYQRYLVICERVEGDDAAATTTSTPTTADKNIFDYVNQATLPSASQDLVVERWVRAIGLLAAIAMAIGLVVYWIRRFVAWLRRHRDGDASVR